MKTLLHYLRVVPAMFLGALFLLPACLTETQETPVQAVIDSVVLYRNPMGLEFTEEEIQLMERELKNHLEAYQTMREYELDNAVPPALRFDPVFSRIRKPADEGSDPWEIPEETRIPEPLDELAAYTIPELASLIRSGKIRSVELTRFFLDRLKKYDPQLHAVITYTEEYALEYARKMDEELEAGKWRGPLHGIPYGIKDLFSFPGYPTTWGAGPYRDQVLDEKATVISRLEEAGAVLVAKLSLGALAMGDVWFNDTTRNPWNLEQGSSGSSAGPAAATAAGLVPFAIGTETLGSIVSPSTRCGVTGLRPSFGRVSRHGAMALSWSMDKIGPICKNADDCAIVFRAIHGPDSLDMTVKDHPFHYPGNVNLKDLTIGYFREAFDEDYRGRENDIKSLEVLQELGARLVPFRFPHDLPVESLNIILYAEAAAAFDELTRSNLDTLLVRQDAWAWPNIFRTARFIPAVEYIQANRFRTLLMEKMNRLMKEVDVVVTPSYGGNQLLITNLTGYPCVVVPNGFDQDNSPTSISFIGNLFDEGTLLAVAWAYQQATPFDEMRPGSFLSGSSGPDE